ncbi:MAG: hypothetical protein P0Y64_16315 [Candidatus Sphingomonas colombiensis]|nr:hypothetical protein [Sphingomonas sp.]WEK42889.1 MAG: hypothetical protein P0Y64_16315 [Sphingomonas sp.]
MGGQAWAAHNYTLWRRPTPSGGVSISTIPQALGRVGGYGTTRALYDTIGRIYTVGARFSFQRHCSRDRGSGLRPSPYGERGLERAILFESLSIMRGMRAVRLGIVRGTAKKGWTQTALQRFLPTKR